MAEKTTAFVGLYRVVLRELQRMKSRPLYAVLLVLLPVASLVTPWLILRQAVPRDLPIAVCDQDDSQISRGITRMLGSSPFLQITERVTDPAEGEALIRSGKVYALVVLPQNLERDIRRGEAPSVATYYNNQWFSVGAIISRELTLAISSEAARLKLGGYMARTGNLQAAVAALQPVRTHVNTLFNPYLNYAYFLIMPLVPTLFQIVMAVTVVFVIGIELKERTAGEWLRLAGGSIHTALWGKLLPYLLIFLYYGALINWWLFRGLGIPVEGNSLVLLLAMALMIFAYIGMGMIIIALTANLRMALGVAAIYVGPAFAFVGLSFPSVGMTKLGYLWSLTLPLTPYLRVMVDQAARGSPPAVSAAPLAILLGFAVLLPLVGTLLLRKTVPNPEKWGAL